MQDLFCKRIAVNENSHADIIRYFHIYINHRDPALSLLQKWRDLIHVFGTIHHFADLPKLPMIKADAYNVHVYMYIESNSRMPNILPAESQ